MNRFLDRFSRQVILPEIGLAGQEKLRQAKVLVVGAGGLGCPAVLYLAAAGVGKIGAVDADQVELSNIHRQVLFGISDIGKDKVEVIQEKISNQYPDVSLEIFPERFSVSNAKNILEKYDLVIDASDNFGTKYLLNDISYLLAKPLIYGAITGFTGQVSVFNLNKNSPSLRCIFPEPPSPKDSPSCAQAGVIGVIPGIIALYQANEVIKLITGAREILSGKLINFDFLKNTQNTLCFARISKPASILTQNDYDALNTCEEKTMESLTAKELKERQDKGEELVLVDVRTPEERQEFNIGGIFIPLQELPERYQEIPKDKTVIIYCRSGGRSGKAIEFLSAEHQYNNVLNLAGGVLGWQEIY